MKNGLKNATDNLYVVGEIIEAAKVCMMTTLSETGLLATRPMYVQEVDENAHIWFFTSANTILVQQIRQNPNIQVTFSDIGNNRFLAATALAEEVVDIQKMKQLWNPSLRAWFPQDLETPGIILLKLTLQDAEYWESPNAAVVRIVSFMKSMLSDEPYRAGRHEHVHLNPH